MRRFLLTVATAASALAVASCSDITGVRGDAAGTYELQTIDGQPLPVTINDPDFGPVTFVYGEIDLGNDGRFVDFYQYSFPGEPVESEQIRGTWEISGDRIRFEPDDPELDVYFMDRRSDRLVQRSRTGGTLVYERD